MATAEGFEVPINQESIETLVDLMDNDTDFEENVDKTIIEV